MRKVSCDNVSSRFLVIVVAAVTIGATWTVRSQSQPDPRETTTISLGKATGPPGGRVTVTVALTTPPGVDVGEFEVIVTAPTPQLTFVTAETGGLADGVDADLQEAVLPGGGKDAARVRVTLSTLKGKATRQPLPNGVLVYLLFSVNKDLKRGQSLTLQATGKAVSPANPSKAIQPLAVKGTTVKVGDAPITSCFFYMH